MTFSQRDLNNLPALKGPSGRHDALSSSTLTGVTRSLTRRRYELIRTTDVGGGGATYGPVKPHPAWTRELGHKRRAMTVMKSHLSWLNRDLSGGDSYPVLNAVLGTAAGLPGGPIGMISGLLYTVATTAIDASRPTSNVLAREGDEIWVYEQIGRYTDRGFISDETGLWHVGLFILIDPFRDNSRHQDKGWVIHEERTQLTV